MSNVVTLTPFKKRQRPATAGRKKGTPNRTTAIIKTTALAACAAVGQPKWDPEKKIWINGSGGFQKYMEWIAKYEPKSMVMLLAKILPTQIQADINGPLRIIDENTPPQEAVILYMAALKAPPVIEATPEPEPHGE